MASLSLLYLIPLLVTCYQYSIANQVQDHPNDSYYKNLPCPIPEDIEPCICTYLEDVGSMDMNCSSIADEQELYNVFHADIPFPKFRKLTLGSNHLTKLSDTVFGDVTFEEVRIQPGGHTLTSVGHKTFIKSASTLRVLYLHHNELSDFPYETLSQYTKLTYFSLYDNPLSSFPLLQSDTLQIVFLGHAAYHTIPSSALNDLPNLERFSVYNMDIGSMATGIFTSVSKLRRIYMYNSGLVHLKSLQFGVNSSTMDLIDLHANQIETVDIDAFKGVQSGTINLTNNKLTILPQATWRSLIDAGVHLQLKDNDLLCGCDIAWIVLEPTYHGLVEDAVCLSGEMLVDLDPSFFENFC